MFCLDDSDADPTWQNPSTSHENVRSHAGNEEGEGDSSMENQTSRQTARKKVRRESLWKRNERQRKRNSGEKYTDRKGKFHEKKILRMYDHSCRFKCNEHIDEEKRKQIFTEFWGLQNYNLQSSFLNSAIKVSRVKTQGTKKKEVSATYELVEFRVCREFFLKTLDVSSKRVYNIFLKKNMSQTSISERDKRGKKVPGNKIPEASVQLGKHHINLFPKYSSHYSRRHTPNRKYLPGTLNVTKMYELYKVFSNEKATEPVTESFYRHIFNTCFNLSFHKPLTV